MKKLMIVRSKSVVAGVAFALAAAVSSSAAVIHVPADHATIQAAVDVAAYGDEIRIAAGVYTNQVVIAYTSLTLSGSPGAVLRATPDMQQSLIPSAGENALGVPLLGIFEADVVISGLTFEGERLAESQPGGFRAIWFVAASGRVEECRITGFRGSTLNSTNGGIGVSVVNPHGYGAGTVGVQVLRSTFADNELAIQLIGDVPGGSYQPTWYPDRLSTTFAVNDNTIVGNGPDSTGRQFGIRIWAGAGGDVMRNTISDYSFVGTNDPVPIAIGIDADDEADYRQTNALAALQPIHFEANVFRNNQAHLVLLRADGSTIVNNSFEGTAPGYRPGGLGFSGENVRVATNRFSDMETGIVLLGNDPDFGTYLGIASNAVLIANGFCNVATKYVFEPLTTYDPPSTLTCPWPTLDIRALQLSWPYSYNGYSVETAPAVHGPWSTSEAKPLLQDGRNSVVIPADSGRQFFRLVKP